MGTNKQLIIEIKSITKKFKNVIAIDNISLNINNSEIVGIVGNNGAGKTTLLRLILDLLKPDGGIILSKNKNVYQSDHWKKYTGAFLDEHFVIDFLTSSEFLNLTGQLRGISKEEIRYNINEFESFMNGEIMDNNKLIRNLSSGNKQKVGIISSLLFAAEIVILDEPFNYIDPSSQIILLKLLKKYVEDKKALMIISSHNLQYVTELCTRIILLEKGQVKYDIINNEDDLPIIKDYFNRKAT